MRRAAFGALIGENRLLRTYDSLGWSTWGWTEPIILHVPEPGVWGYISGGLPDPDLYTVVPEYDSWDGVPDLIDELEPAPDAPVLENYSIVTGIREVIATFGENVVALAELANGWEAICHSPDSGETWTKVLEVTEIYDITSVGYNWTLASTSDGWYSSLTSGSTWELMAAAGPGVPVGISVVWVMPNHLFCHTGSEIWLSEDRAATWEMVCDLTAIEGYLTNNKFHSIDGYQGRVIATCGYSLIETQNLGATWDIIDLPTVVRAWSYMAPDLPIWRQVAFWDARKPDSVPEYDSWGDVPYIDAVEPDPGIVPEYYSRVLEYRSWDNVPDLIDEPLPYLDAEVPEYYSRVPEYYSDPTMSRWMISSVLARSDIIRTFVARGDGRISPVVDMALSERHRLNVSVARRAGVDITDTALMITGDRRVDGELRHALTISRDGIIFDDVLGGALNTLSTPSNTVMDAAHATLAQMVIL